MVNKLQYWFTIFLLAAAAEVTAKDDITLQFDSMPLGEFSKAVYADILESGYVIEEGLSEQKISIYAPHISKKNIKNIADDVLATSGLTAQKIGNLYHIQKTSSLLIPLVYRPRNRPVRYIYELIKQAYPDIALTLRRDKVQQQNQDTIQDDNGANANAVKNDFDYFIFQAPKQKHPQLLEFIELVDQKNKTVRIIGASYEYQSTSNKGSAFSAIFDLFKNTISLSIGASLDGASSILKINGFGISSILQVLDSDSRFKSISKPSLLVDSGEHAKFNSGQDVPVLTSTTVSNGLSTQGVEYRSSGILLDVLPTVYKDSIDLKVKQEISSFSKTQLSNIQSPTLNKRLIDTKLSLKNGDIVILAGLSEVTQNVNRQGLAAFNFFGQKENKQFETVLILQVTSEGNETPT